MLVRLLVLGSLLFLAATTYMVVTKGALVYYVAFHKPWHLSLFGGEVTNPEPVQLPQFTAVSTVTVPSLSTGSREAISTKLTASETTDAVIEVWVQSPEHTQPFQNALGAPIHFVKGVSQSFSYPFTVGESWPVGTYTVSELVASPNGQTDYYVHNDFASFVVL